MCRQYLNGIYSIVVWQQQQLSLLPSCVRDCLCKCSEGVSLLQPAQGYQKCQFLTLHHHHVNINGADGGLGQPLPLLQEVGDLSSWDSVVWLPTKGHQLPDGDSWAQETASVFEAMPPRFPHSLSQQSIPAQLWTAISSSSPEPG